MHFQFRLCTLFFPLLSAAFVLASAQDDALSRLKKDIAALAGPEMEGRGNGQPGLEKAIDYVVDTYVQLGLKPAIQRFPYRLANNSNNSPDGHFSNVIVAVNGSDPELRSQHIVVGAHLDHLGIRPSTGGPPSIYFGADDNASGSAAVMELVRYFHKNPPPRTILFIHFTGEEWGLHGSKYWVANPTVDIKSVLFMANLDMIGRLGRDEKASLTFTAMGMGPDAIAHAKEMAPEGIVVEADRGTSIFSAASDHAPFVAAGIPTFFMFTGIHPDYHRTSDTIDKINWDGLSAITLYAQRLIEEYASAADVPSFQPRANLGMASEPGDKARVWSIRPGGSADSAGLARGDVLTFIDGHQVNSATDLVRTLDLFNRGDSVRLKWERGGRQMEAQVVLQ